MRPVVLLLTLAAVGLVVAGPVRINFRRCDRGQQAGRRAAEACEQHFCTNSTNFVGQGVWWVRGALDKFGGCESCLDSRCAAGDTQYCQGTALRDSCRRTPPQPGDRVAVVGGGISGLFAARYLTRNGYHVTMYEADEELAATTESLAADGHVFDYATKFVMPNTPLGPMQQTMMDMVSDYGMTFRESPLFPGIPSFSWWPGTTPALAALPHILLPLIQADPQKFVQDLIIGHGLLAAMQVSGVRCPADLINLGFVLPTESYADWSARVNLPGFTTLLGFIHDGFLQGESDIQPAAIIVNVRRNMLPPLIKSILIQGFGVTAAQIDPVLLPALHALLSDPFVGSSYTFLEGMQEFFNRLADVEQLDVRLRSEVRKLRFVNGKVRVVAKRQPNYLFDHVVVAVKPQQAIPILSKHPEMQAIMQRAAPIEPKVSWALRATGPPMLGAEYNTFIFPDALSFPPDGSITATAKDFADSDVVFAIGYADHSLSAADAETEMQSDMAAAGYTVNEVLGLRVYDYPATLSVAEVAAGWYDDAFAQQGNGNVYYVGEIWSGANIPNLLDHVEKLMPTAFPSNSPFTLKSVADDEEVLKEAAAVKARIEAGPSPTTKTLHHHYDQLVLSVLTEEALEAVEAVPIHPLGDVAVLIHQLQLLGGGNKQQQ